MPVKHTHTRTHTHTHTHTQMCRFFFLVSYFINNQLVFTAVNSLHSFSQHNPRYAAMGSGGWEGNFLITASSKDKTFCHLLYSLQKQKPSVKIIKTCCQKHQNHQNHLSKTSKPAVIYYTALKNKNLLSKSSKNIKTCCQNIKTIKTTCQNHQKHQNLL